MCGVCDVVFSHYRRVANHTGLMATFGSNKFIVKYPKSVAAQFPDHVRSATFHARLISNKAIINVNMNFTHDDMVRAEDVVSRVGVCC